MSPRSGHEHARSPLARPLTARAASDGQPRTNSIRSAHVASADLAGFSSFDREAGHGTSRSAQPQGDRASNHHNPRSARQGASLGTRGQTKEGAGHEALAPSTLCNAASWKDTLSVTFRALGRDLKSRAGREEQDRRSRYQARPASQRASSRERHLQIDQQLRSNLARYYAAMRRTVGVNHADDDLAPYRRSADLTRFAGFDLPGFNAHRSAPALCASERRRNGDIASAHHSGMPAAASTKPVSSSRAKARSLSVSHGAGSFLSCRFAWSKKFACEGTVNASQRA